MQKISKFLGHFSKKPKAILIFGLVFHWILVFFPSVPTLPEEAPREIQKNLLRVLPAFRPEECDWAIRKFICLRCLRNGFSYAQKIVFLEDDRPFRLHGCYSEEKGFFPISEGRDEELDFTDR